MYNLKNQNYGKAYCSISRQSGKWIGAVSVLGKFYENQIIYRVYAVAETTDMRTNSGIRFYADDVIENLKGHAHEYDALVFSCGDAVPVFKEHASEAHNVALMQVV